MESIKCDAAERVAAAEEAAAAADALEEQLAPVRADLEERARTHAAELAEAERQ